MLRRLKGRLHHEPPAWLLITAIIFFIILISSSVAYWVFASSYEDKIYPGVYIGSINLGGLTDEQASATLNKVLDQYQKSGLTVSYKDKKAQLYPNLTTADGDLAATLIDFDVDAMVNRAYNYGREADPVSNLAFQLNTLLSSHVIAPTYAINEGQVAKYLTDSFKADIKLGENAKLAYQQGRFIAIPEKNGYQFDFASVIRQIDLLVSNLQFGPITLAANEVPPQITAAGLQDLISTANSQLEVSPLTIHHAKSSWDIKATDLSAWLIATSSNGQTSLGLDSQKIKAFLDKHVAPKIEIKVTDARFEIKNGRAVAFSTAKDGLAIDATTTIENIRTDWLTNRLSSTSLATYKVPSQSSTTDTNDLGIKEIIGVGTSNFAGSSANRKTNIRVGMGYLNGHLIPPGATFSVMKNLGTIDGSKGYLQELVIKGDKTEKEFGGGLCQIGTTMFRAALASGLPIVERRNHSYRVGYYEPAGTDATIYDPSPDLKFLNDTGNYILIQGYISGNKLSFEFWGTKDGRKAHQTYPAITNIVKPAPTKLIETLSLAPGVRKCTEKAHNGADASFTYTVTYADGEIKKRKFNSHYVPWREVCLIGVKSLSSASSTASNAGASQASSTPAKPPATTGASSSKPTAASPTSASSTKP